MESGELFVESCGEKKKPGCLQRAGFLPRRPKYVSIKRYYF